MIYGKIWLVVKPSVGVPLLLGAVAVSSFAVHYALLTHTTWLPGASDVLTHGFERRPVLLEEGLVAAHQHGDLAARRLVHPAGHRALQRPHAAFRR